MRFIAAALLAFAAWAALAAPPALELLAPKDEAATTTREFVNVLGRSAPGARVSVGGEAAAVFATGIFVRDRVPLVLGRNRIEVVATLNGERSETMLEVERLATPTPLDWPRDRLWLDGASLRPAELRQLAPGESIEFGVRATPGQKVELRLPGEAGWITLAETTPGSGRYQGHAGWPASRHDDVAAAPWQLRVSARTLTAPGGPARRLKPLLALSPAAIGLWASRPDRLVRVADNASTNANATSPAFPVALLHGNHEVRLGGPSLAEALPGTLLRAVAQHGNRLRVMLAPGAEAWIDERAIEAVAPGTRLPIPVFTSFSVDAAAEAATTSEADVVNLPLGATPLPYAARPRPLPDGRQGLELMLWGTHYAQTWISHRAGRRWVDDVTAEPAGPDRLRLQIALKPGQRLWGWRIEKSPAGLRVLLRAAPRLATAPDSPLKGLRVAVEAGHGSADNLGAVGATGVPEKDINRWTADALAAELQAAGAEVVVIRDGDSNPPLAERARRVTASNAHLFVSIHANAADTANGYLRVSGTSVYYKHETGRGLAASVQTRLLADTGLADFGLVGNFNYAPIRLASWAPAILVELAFMSHPGDEARLLDPSFRAAMARSIRLGLEQALHQHGQSRATPLGSDAARGFHTLAQGVGIPGIKV